MILHLNSFTLSNRFEVRKTFLNKLIIHFLCMIRNWDRVESAYDQWQIYSSQTNILHNVITYKLVLVSPIHNSYKSTFYMLLLPYIRFLTLIILFTYARFMPRVSSSSVMCFSCGILFFVAFFMYFLNVILSSVFLTFNLFLLYSLTSLILHGYALASDSYSCQGT